MNVLRTIVLSLGLSAFVAFVAGGLVAANTMVFTAELAGLCKEGKPELSVDERTRNVDKDGVTVLCIQKESEKIRDVGVFALFIGWGLWTAAFFVVLSPVFFVGMHIIARRGERR